MIIIKILSLLFIVFASYMILDWIIPALIGRQPFALMRYVFKGKDIDEEIKDFESQQMNNQPKKEN